MQGNITHSNSQVGQRLITFPFDDTPSHQHFQLVKFADLRKVRALLVRNRMFLPELLQFHDFVGILEPGNALSVLDGITKSLDFVHSVLAGCQFDCIICRIVEHRTWQVNWVQEWHEFWWVSLEQALSVGQDVHQIEFFEKLCTRLMDGANHCASLLRQLFQQQYHLEARERV